MQTIRYILFVVSMYFFIVEADEGKSVDREKELDQMIQEIIFQRLHFGDPSHEEMLNSLIKNKEATREEIESILLKYLAGKGELTEGHFGDTLRDRLKSSSILYLGYIKSKKALPILKKMIVESNDEKIKYSCAQSILQTEDDPVPFIGELLSGKILPDDFQYTGSLIERIQNIYKDEAKKAKPSKKLLDGIKEALLKYISTGKDKTTYLLNADYVLCAIDADYKKSDSRKKALENIFGRKEALNDIQKQCIEKELKSFETSP